MGAILDRLSELVSISMSRELSPEERKEVQELEGKLAAILSTKK